MPTAEPRFRLRQLPGEVRLVLGAFLVLAAAGYVAALVQVHYQSAVSDELLPGPNRVRQIYGGSSGPTRSRIEQPIEAEHGPFNAQARWAAFTTQSRAGRVSGGRSPDELHLIEEREGERLALLVWVRGGATSGLRPGRFLLGAELTGQPVTPELLAGPRVKIRTLIQTRCGLPLRERVGGERRLFPLDTHERLKPYLQVQPSTQMSPPRLAQTTHAHLLGSRPLRGDGNALLLHGCVAWGPIRPGPLPLVAQGSIPPVGGWPV